MVPCTNCKSTSKPVYRTNPLGEVTAGWMCEPCINKLHHPSLIDQEVKKVVTFIHDSN